MNIILISGKMGSGKDYVADRLIEKLSQHDLKVERMAFADPIRKEIDYIIDLIKCGSSTKEISKTLNVSEKELDKLIKMLESDSEFYQDGFDMESRPKFYRELLQYWGTDVRRRHNKNYWIRKVKETLLDCAPFIDVAVLTDARFGNEVASMYDFNHVYTVRLQADKQTRKNRVLNRDGEAPIDSELKHVSETAINDSDINMMEHFDMVTNAMNNNGDQIASLIFNNYQHSNQSDVDEIIDAFIY